MTARRNPVTGAAMTAQEQFNADEDSAEIQSLIRQAFESEILAKDYRDRAPVDAPRVVVLPPVERLLAVLLIVAASLIAVYLIAVAIGKAGS